MSKDKMACDGGDVWAQRPHTGKEVVGGGASCSHSLALPQHRRQGIRTGPGQAKVCSWQIRPDPEVAVGTLMDDLSTYRQYKPSTWVVNFYISLREYYLLWAHLRSYIEIKQVSKPAVIFVDFLWLWSMWHICINQAYLPLYWHFQISWSKTNAIYYVEIPILYRNPSEIS